MTSSFKLESTRIMRVRVGVVGVRRVGVKVGGGECKREWGLGVNDIDGRYRSAFAFCGGIIIPIVSPLRSTRFPSFRGEWTTSEKVDGGRSAEAESCTYRHNDNR